MAVITAVSAGKFLATLDDGVDESLSAYREVSCGSRSNTVVPPMPARKFVTTPAQTAMTAQASSKTFLAVLALAGEVDIPPISLSPILAKDGLA